MIWCVVVFERGREQGRVEGKKGGSEVLFSPLLFTPLSPSYQSLPNIRRVRERERDNKGNGRGVSVLVI